MGRLTAICQMSRPVVVLKTSASHGRPKVAVSVDRSLLTRICRERSICCFFVGNYPATDCAILCQMRYVLCHLMPNAVPSYAKRASANPGVLGMGCATLCQIRHFLSNLEVDGIIWHKMALNRTVS